MKTNKPPAPTNKMAGSKDPLPTKGSFAEYVRNKEMHAMV